MEAGDANPEKSRSLIKNFSMFNYPTHSDAPSAPHSIPAEEKPSVQVDPKEIESEKLYLAEISRVKLVSGFVVFILLKDPL